MGECVSVTDAPHTRLSARAQDESECDGGTVPTVAQLIRG